MPNADWLKIKNEYINTDISYRELAKKHNVSFNTLKARAIKEKWRELREKQHNRITMAVQQKTAEKVATQEAARVARILSLADKLADKLEQAIEQTDQYMAKRTTRMETTQYDAHNRPFRTISSDAVEYGTVNGIIDKRSLKQLTAALKDIKDVQAVQSDEDQYRKLDEILNRIGGDF